MIGGEAVYNVQVVPQGLHVLSGPQHGTHLPLLVPQPVKVVQTEEQVMRRHLAGNLDAFLLGSLNDQDLKKAKRSDKWTSYGKLKAQQGWGTHLFLLSHMADVHRTLI